MSTRARSSTLGCAIVAVLGVGAAAVACVGFRADRARLDSLPTRDHYADGAAVFVGAVRSSARFVEVIHTLHGRRSSTTVLACSEVPSDLGLAFADGSSADVDLADQQVRLSREATDGFDVTADLSTTREGGDVGDPCRAEASPIAHPSAVIHAAYVAAGTRLQVIGCGEDGRIVPCGDLDLDLVTDGDARERVAAEVRTALLGLAFVPPFCALFMLFDVAIKVRQRRDAVHAPEGPAGAERRLRFAITIAVAAWVGVVVVEIASALVAFG